MMNYNQLFLPFKYRATTTIPVLAKLLRVLFLPFKYRATTTGNFTYAYSTKLFLPFKYRATTTIQHQKTHKD